MANEELKKLMLEKIDEGEFEVADLPQYIELFCEISNESEDVQDEIDGWSRTFQITLDGADDFWLKIDDGDFSTGLGEVNAPDIRLKASGENAAAIFTGEKDATAAYMSGKLKVDGKLPDAVKLRSIIEIVRDELED